MSELTPSNPAQPDNETFLNGSEQGIILAVGLSQYCVPILQVSTIIEYERPTTIPHSPRYVEGAINLRGNIIPVVNLGMYLDVESTPGLDHRYVVIAETPDPSDPQEIIVFGLLIDKVVRIFDMATRTVQPISADGGKSDLSGLVMLGGEDGKSAPEMIGVLDLAAIAAQVTGKTAGLASMEF